MGSKHWKLRFWKEMYIKSMMMSDIRYEGRQPP